MKAIPNFFLRQGFCKILKAKCCKIFASLKLLILIVNSHSEISDNHILQTNSFQAVIISNLTKTYAVYIYNCDSLTWSDEATIGFNAAADYYANHPLSGQLHANAIGCVHLSGDTAVLINNVVYDLVPNMANATTPMPPPASLGEYTYNYNSEPMHTTIKILLLKQSAVIVISSTSLNCYLAIYKGNFTIILKEVSF